MAPKSIPGVDDRLPQSGASHARYLIGDRMEVRRADFGDSDFRDSTIAFFCRYARGKSVLDLGCVDHNPEGYQSKYWIHKALRAVAARLTGLDLYEKGVRYLRERGFDVVEGDAENIELDDTFEVIVAGELIEHLASPGALLASARRHLTPGGMLLISTPNPWYWRYVVKSIFSWNVRPNPEHVSWYCGATLKALLARYGFEMHEFARGSRYLRDRLLPLPAGLKHTTIYVAARLVPAETNV